ncbi:MAG: hypothetical protein ABIJ45_09345, partial [Candidatus Zixiibacteriota bacterium]
DNLNIHAISKKDEIVQAARKEAEQITLKIENFGENYQRGSTFYNVTNSSKIKAVRILFLNRFFLSILPKWRFYIRLFIPPIRRL